MTTQVTTPAQQVFTIGAEVHCQDGQCGKLAKVVLDPHTRRVTDLIVEQGFLQVDDRVVPISVVAEADEDRIQLTITREELKDYQAYREDAFWMPAPGWDSRRYATEQVRYWVPQHGLVVDTPIVPRVRQQVHIGVPANRRLLERGTPVRNLMKKLGEVDHILVHRDTTEVTHLVMRHGVLPEYHLIPFEKVTSADEDAVYVKLSQEEVEDLPRYHPRKSEDMLAELRDRLNAAAFDFSGVKAAIEAGVARLTGSVTDVAAKRSAEATARRVDGIVDVENQLQTDTAVAARVAAALESDPRTDLGVIEAHSEHGVVTLTGSVDRSEVREAAEEIAAAQKGVADVINALDVQPDADSEVLPARE